MQFSDTTNKNGLIQRCETYTGLGDAVISGDTTRLKQFTAWLNSAYHEVVSDIIEAMDDWDFDDGNLASEAVITKDFTANQRYVLTALSDKILKVKRVDVSYDGSNWYRAKQIDLNDISESLYDSGLDARFHQSEPCYDQNGLYIYFFPKPTANSSSGVKIRVVREIDEFTTSDTTQEPGIDEQFHPLLALKASLTWAIPNHEDRIKVIQPEIDRLYSKMVRFYSKKNVDQPMSFGASHVSYS